MTNSRVTLEDIANQAGVSVAAVSQALSGKGKLSQPTRDRIMKVVEELAYKPDKIAQSLALRSTTQAGGRRPGRGKGKSLPPPGMMVFYNIPELIEVVHLEIQQKEEEGFEVGPFRQRLRSWARPTKQKLYQLYSEVLAAPARSDWAYQEPDSLHQIHIIRPDGPRDARLAITSSALLERINGAWSGRIAGCVCGKPLQAGWSKSQVIEYLQVAGSYPLRGYVPRMVPPPAGFDFKPEAAGNFLGEIHGAKHDDDTDYSILTLHLLENYGLEFKTADVATEWLTHLPYFGTYTTERAIYRNLVWNVHPEEAARYVNPEREFIGARTRADVYGYAAPGKPELAAALAYKDAALSHTRNGIYASMFMAALISWSFVTNDIEELVRVGLSEIPANCRLAEAIHDVLHAYHDTGDWEPAYEHLLIKYGTYSPIHAINNTVWTVLALLFSEGDFTNGLGLAVSCGMDTGSNAANVGSVLGLMCGRSHIPSHWINPLQDTLYTATAQFPEVRISELAQRTAEIAEKVLSGSS